MRGAVFDFDGVLVDSEPLHYSSLRECLLPEDVDLGLDEYVRHCLAYDDREAVRVALDVHGRRYDPEQVDRCALRKAELFAALAGNVKVFPGARELVQVLAAEMPVAVASGALHDEIELILKTAGLRDAFVAVVGADDVAHTKPHPEPYREAVARLAQADPEIQPGDCLAFEDTMAGIASAREAGLKVVAVTNSYAAGRLSAADHVVPSLEGLAPAELRELLWR